MTYTEPEWIFRLGLERNVPARLASILGAQPSSYWRLGEIGTTTATDQAGASNGTYTGTYTLGRRGLALGDRNGAVEVDGVTGRVVVSDVYDFPNVDPFTVHALVTFDTSPSGANMAIVHKANATSGWAIYGSVGGGSGGSLGSIVLSRRSATLANVDFGVSVGVVVPGRTYDVLGVFNGSTITVYVDGVAGTPGASTRNLPGNALSLTFGTNPAAGAPFDGTIDEVWILSDDITAQQAADISEMYLGIDLVPYLEGQSNRFLFQRGVGQQRVSLAAQVPIRLDNFDGDWTRHNSASPYWRKLDGDLPIQFSCVHAGVYRDLWRGYVRRQEAFYPRGNRPYVAWTCESWQSVALRTKLRGILLSTSRRTDQALVAVVDQVYRAGIASYFSGAELYADTGNQTLVAHWAGNEVAQANIEGIVASELGGVAYEMADGRLRFRKSDALVHGTPDATWGDGTAIRPNDIEVDPGVDLVNARVERTAISQVIGSAATTVYTSARAAANSNSPQIPANSTLITFVPLSSPCSVLAGPTATTDYLANDLANGGGANRTASLVVAQLGGGSYVLRTYTNTHTANVYLTLEIVRGTPHTIASFADVTQGESGPVLQRPRGSIVENELALPLPYMSQAAAAADWWARINHHERQWPVPIVTQEYSWADDDTIAAMLAGDLHQLIAFDNRLIPISPELHDWYRVIGLEHEISPGNNHLSRVRLKPSYTYKFWYNDFWRGARMDANSSNALTVDDYGAAITNLSNSFIVTGGAVPAINGFALSWWNVTKTNFEVNDRIGGVFQIAAGKRYGIAFSGVDVSNYYFFGVTGAAGGVVQVQLFKTVAGVDTTIEAAVDIDYISGLDYFNADPLNVPSVWLRVHKQGTRIRCYVNQQSVPIFDVDDSEFSTGKVGILSDDTTCYHNMFMGVGL